MKWPWVSGKRAQALIDSLSAEAQKIQDDLKNARAAGEEVTHRLAACDAERLEVKKNFAELAALSRALEEKLKDCTDPPITRKELQKLTKLIASLRAERDGLQAANRRLTETLERNEERMAKAEAEGDAA